MLPPSRSNARAQAKAQGASIPAPVLGWNARDPLDGMKDGYAVKLDNWFPQAGYVEVRSGTSTHSTITQIIDFGAITDAATTTEDLGDLTTSSSTIDLGEIV